MSRMTPTNQNRRDRFAENFGARLRRRREELGVMQIDLARALGISSGLVSHWENATRVPPLWIVWDLAAALQWTPDRMLAALK